MYNYLLEISLAIIASGVLTSMVTGYFQNKKNKQERKAATEELVHGIMVNISERQSDRESQFIEDMRVQILEFREELKQKSEENNELVKEKNKVYIEYKERILKLEAEINLLRSENEILNNKVIQLNQIIRGRNG